MRKDIVIIKSSAFLLLLVTILTGCGIQEITPKHSSILHISNLQEGLNSIYIPKDEIATSQIKGNIKIHSKSNNTKFIDYENINEVRIPVLMFHSIKAKGKNSLVMSPVEFEKKMKWLKDNNYATLSMEELYLMLTTGKKVPERPIILTFDDGYADNYTNAYPILKRYNLKATVFLITNKIGLKGFLKTEQIKEMAANNIDFQSHTAKHLELNLLSYSNQLEEMKKSKKVIEDLLHNNTNVLCYPVGKYNESTKKAAKAAGYKMCFTTNHGFSKSSDGLYTLTRIRAFPGIRLESIKRN